MRKQMLSPAAAAKALDPSAAWLDLDRIAQVEVTSEDPGYPVESAFTFGDSPGWRAAGRGEQTIRLTFDQPQRLTRIWLRFVETGAGRTQQFTLRWSPDRESLGREIVRQQWNFSPNGATTEIENYTVDLKNVLFLELTINPDMSGGEAVATLADWRVA